MEKILNNRPNKLIDNNGIVYDSLTQLEHRIGVHHSTISNWLKRQGFYEHDGVRYYLDKDNENPSNVMEELSEVERQEFEEFKKMKDVKNLDFSTYDFKYTPKKSGIRYAVALFSDAHIEETVLPASVLGMNEYNIKIAEQRIQKYFQNLCDCLNTDNVEELIFASLGDTISGYIHEELSQCNELTPLEATFKAQSLLFGGLKYICDNTSVKSIKFVGIVGNHSRVTKKIQHANGFKLSYEWLMYQNIKQHCETLGMPIDFYIPESEIAIINTPDNKRLIFAHGFQIKGGGTGTVCGIYPALNRLSLKWNNVFGQDKIYIGHFHQCVSISNAVVNGSIIGYNSYALTNGFSYEEPAQMYEVYDTKIGQILTRKIYCK
jgi:hypothetical protein